MVSFFRCPSIYKTEDQCKSPGRQDESVVGKVGH